MGIGRGEEKAEGMGVARGGPKKSTNSTDMDAALNGLAPSMTEEDDAATVTCLRLLSASRVPRNAVRTVLSCSWYESVPANGP